jgi:diguanylate cyclase (GGDEF)-like protein
MLKLIIGGFQYNFIINRWDKYIMNSLTLTKKYNIYLKYFLIFLFSILAIISELLLQNINFAFPITLSSISLFIIIGLANGKSSFFIILLINIIFFFTNDFNILSTIEFLQVYFMWFLYQKNKKNILMNALLFILIISLPLMLINLYFTNSSLDINTVFFFLIIFLNKIFNALVADLFLQYISLRKIVPLPTKHEKKLTLSNLLTYTLIASVIIPVIVFVIIAVINTEKEVNLKVTEDLHLASDYVNDKIENWTIEEKSNLKLNNPIHVSKLLDILNVYVSTSDSTISFYLVDFNNKIISNLPNNDYSSLGLNWIKDGSIDEFSPGFYTWWSPIDTSYLIKNYSKDCNYVYVTSIDNSKILISIPSSQYTSTIISGYLESLKILIPLALILFLVISLLKNIILKSISKVIILSSGLPEKLKSKETIVFENSNILEIDSLIYNFQSMVDNLSNMILEAEITNKKLEESRKLLFKQANYDYLTELPNRQYFIEHAKNTINEFSNNNLYNGKNGIAILFLDLDKFKIVNDTLGHSAGDKLLQIIAKKMKEILNSYDSNSACVARLGGDEFVIQLIYNDKYEIEELSTKIIETIKQPINLDSSTITVGVSIGVGLYPEDGNDIESIFIKSDTSMYKAKASGGNEVYI